MPKEGANYILGNTHGYMVCKTRNVFRSVHESGLQIHWLTGKMVRKKLQTMRASPKWKISSLKKTKCHYHPQVLEYISHQKELDLFS